MSMLFRRIVRWALVAIALVVLGWGIYQNQVPAPKWEIIGGGGAPKVFPADAGRRLLVVHRFEIKNGVSTADGPLEIRDSTTGELVNSFFKEQAALTSIVYSDAGILAAQSRGANEPKTSLHLLNVNQNTLNSVDVADGDPARLFLAPHGKTVVRSVHVRGVAELHIHDSSDGRRLDYLPKTEVLDLGNSLALFKEATDFINNLAIWSRADGKVIERLGFLGRSAAILAGERFCLIDALPERRERDGKWAIWDSKARRIEGTLELNDLVPGADIAFSQDGSRCAAARVGPECFDIEVRDLPECRVVGKHRIVVSLDAKSSNVPSRIVLAPDGNRLAVQSIGSLGSSGIISMFEVPAMKLAWKADNNDHLLKPTFSVDSQIVFVAAEDTLGILAIDARTGDERASMAIPSYCRSNEQPLNVIAAKDGKASWVFQKAGKWRVKREETWKDWLAWLPWATRGSLNDNDLLVVLYADYQQERFRLEKSGAIFASLSENADMVVTVHQTSESSHVIRGWVLDAWKPLHWAVGVPASLGAIIVMFACWRGRRKTQMAAQSRSGDS